VIFDTDDLYEGHDNMALLLELKAANAAFRLSAFAPVGLCSDDYIESLPDWIEVIPHGYAHGDPPTDGGEMRDWDYDRMCDLIHFVENASPRWQRGVKAPGWIISAGCYQALADHSWFLADQTYNDARRPLGLRVHCEGQGDHVHTHVQDVCGNGLRETFPYLLERVRTAESFELISEVVVPWQATAVFA
jgi:hypothetical protein